MARGWKRAVEILATKAGVTRLFRSRNAPSTAILAYHNIVPTGEPLAGDASLHVDQRTFAEQLDFVAEHHDVIPLSEAHAGGEPSRRPRVVITFDDAYHGTMTAGVDELRARGLPATVFVPPGLLGSSGFWWDLIAPAGGGAIPASVRDHALEALQGRCGPVLEWAGTEGITIRELPRHARPADEATVRSRAASGPIALGAHTWSHPNLAALPEAEVDEEFVRSVEWVRENAPQGTDWLAYPYGLSTPSVVRSSRDRFAGALMIRGGVAQLHGAWRAPLHETPRLNVPRGLTIEGLALRLAGLRG